MVRALRVGIGGVVTSRVGVRQGYRLVVLERRSRDGMRLFERR
jgi:hypothetical protein